MQCYDKETYGGLLKTDSDEEPVVKYNVALCAQDSASLEKKQRQLNRDIPSEDKSRVSLSHNTINRTDNEDALNEEKDTVPCPTGNYDKSESQKAWTMGMPMIDGDISTINTEELTQIEDRNKKFLYARAVHANHMIQHHMHEISECQRVVNESQFMADVGREMIPLESDKYKSDPVINQHIMQMIDTNIYWYGQTFMEILMELWKIRNGETPTKTSKESNETAMMFWESFDDNQHASKKQKNHAQDDETNNKAHDMDNKMHTKHTTNMGKHFNIPVGALRLGADNNASTLATQETSAKNLVYITNMPESTLDAAKNVQDSSKNTSEQEDKKCSSLDKSDQVTSNNNLNAYGESDRDDDP